MKPFAEVPPRIRGQVAYFADLMEAELRQNDQKRGWSDCGPLWLQVKLTEEMGELGALLAKLHNCKGESYDSTQMQDELKAAIWEAVDIANIAMMLADVLSEKLK